ncbi:MAG: FecR family protein [bacterium]
MTRRILAGLSVAVFLFGLSVMAHAAEVKATLGNVAGDVQVQAAPDADWEAAADGVALGKGAAIKTGADGEAILTWGIGNVVRIFPLTNISVESLMEEGEDTTAELSLAGGRALSQVGKLASPNSSFKVKTPSAVAGVRGTAFDAAIPPGGGSVSIACVDGAVILTVGDIEVTIEEGFELSVTAGEVPITPAAIPEARLKNLQAATNVLKQIAKESEKAEKKEKKEEKKAEKKEDTSSGAVDTVMDDTSDQVTIQDDITNTAADLSAGPCAAGGCGSISGSIEFPQN